MYHFSTKSKRNLSTCYSNLQILFGEVIKHRDCSVLYGFRSELEQNKLYLADKTPAMWPESLHNRSPSWAVDVMPYPIDWDDTGRIIEFAGFVLGTASQMKIDVFWGGHFKSYFDGPHYELFLPK